MRLALLALVFTVAAQPPPRYSQEYGAALRDVQDLEPEDVAALEKRLQAQPHDLIARLKLMAYHMRGDRAHRPEDQALRVEQALWVIEHHPESEIAGSPYAWFAEGQLTAAQVQRARELWARAVQARPGDARLLWNAAQFFRGLDRGLYAAYLRGAAALAPGDEMTSRELGWLCAGAIIAEVQPGRLDANLAPAGRRQLDATKQLPVLLAAIELFQAEYNKSLMIGREDRRFSDLAVRYFERARTLDPKLERDKVLRQIDPKMKGMLAAGARPPEEDQRRFDEAAKHIRRLPPAAFPELPAGIRKAIEERRCAVPQPEDTPQHRNVIRGEFFAKGQAGWAVLCSVSGSSSILVFRGDTDARPDELAGSEDKLQLQGLGDDRIGYSRDISPVDRKYIVSHYRAYGGPEPPSIDHHGIDDAFIGKASVVHYHHQGKWLRLQGTD